MSNTCTICFEEVENDFKKLNCNHVFHQKCLEEWFFKTKPRLDEYDCYRSGTCPNCQEFHKDVLFPIRFESLEINFTNSIKLICYNSSKIYKNFRKKKIYIS